MSVEEKLKDLQLELYLGGQWSDDPELISKCLYELIELIMLSRAQAQAQAQGAPH